MVPHINIGKRPRDPWHASMFLGYPSDTPFGNLALAEMEMFIRIDYINDCLEALYRDWCALVPGLKGFVPPEVPWLRFRTEELVSSVRRVCDALISTSHILGERVTTGSYPTRLRIDCIGHLLRRFRQRPENQPSYLVAFSPHVPVLSLMNEMSNTFKHHFVNFETVNVVGSREPSAFYLTMDRNDTDNNPAFKGVPLSLFISDIDRLITDVREDHERLLAELNTPEGEQTVGGCG